MSAPSPIQPAGTSPLGLLVGKDYVLPEGQPDGIAADAIDPVTGEYLSIRLGFNPIDAWILGQLAVVRGSGSAVINDGRDYSDVTHAREQDREVFRQETLRPLKPLISAREIEASVTTEIEGDSIAGYLTYKNLANGQTRENIRVPAGGLVGDSVR